MINVDDSGNIRALDTKPTDRELAIDLRAKLEAALNVVVTEMNKAEATSGLRVNFQLGRDGFGRNCIAHISIMRLLCVPIIACLLLWPAASHADADPAARLHAHQFRAEQLRKTGEERKGRGCDHPERPCPAMGESDQPRPVDIPIPVPPVATPAQ